MKFDRFPKISDRSSRRICAKPRENPSLFEKLRTVFEKNRAVFSKNRAEIFEKFRSPRGNRAKLCFNRSGVFSPAFRRFPAVFASIPLKNRSKRIEISKNPPRRSKAKRPENRAQSGPIRYPKNSFVADNVRNKYKRENKKENKYKNKYKYKRKREKEQTRKKSPPRRAAVLVLPMEQIFRSRFCGRGLRLSSRWSV